MQDAFSSICTEDQERFDFAEIGWRFCASADTIIQMYPSELGFLSLHETSIQFTASRPPQPQVI